MTVGGQAMITQMKSRLNANARLVEQGRLVSGTVLMRVGDDAYKLIFDKGGLVDIQQGPFPMPNVDFTISAAAEEWRDFWQPVPKPGSHDLMAMLKRRVLTLEGNMHLFMSNLFYFKAVFALLREEKGQ